MPTGQQYSSNAVLMTLAAGISNSSTTCTVNTTSGLPATPFTIVLDPGEGNQEICDVTNVTGLTLTLARAVDGSAASAHSNGATVMHAGIGRDFREFRSHIDASTSNDNQGHNVHGIQVGSSVVGTTDTQTLSGKTLTSPTVNNGTFNSPSLITPTLNRATLVDSSSGQVPLTVNAVNGQTADLADFKVNGVTVANIFADGSIGAKLVAVAGNTGAANSSRYVGATTGGPPTSGTFNQGDWVIDRQWGIQWACTSAGTPGTWAPSGPAKIATETPSGVNTFNFPSIPNYFRHLQIRWIANSTTANQVNNLFLQFNGDSGNTYNRFQKLNNSGADNNSASAGQNSITIGNVWANGTSNRPGSGTVDINGYSNTSLAKTAVSTGITTDGSTTGQLGIWGGEWLNTVAIANITIILANSANFNAGSQFDLYAFG